MVDDDPFVLNALQRVLRDHSGAVLTASSATEALSVLARTRVDVAVLDYWMPGQNGLWLAQAIKEKYPQVVRIMLTGCAELAVVREAANRGDIYRYLLKPWDRIELLKTLNQAMNAALFAPAEPPAGEWSGLHDLIASAVFKEEERSRFLDLGSAWDQRMVELSKAVESRDPNTLGHSSRVTVLAMLLAQSQSIGLAPELVIQLKLGALMHDVGKVAVPDSILFKPGKLTPQEMELIQNHTVVGHRILKDQGAPDHISAIARHHHENFDGTGYPDRLAGLNIPLAARIVRLADTFDAMRHKRPYRDGLPLDFIWKTFRELAGLQFDPDLVEPFIALTRDKDSRLMYNA